ncbi:hypothetical protein OJAV_G00084180 [Oryzias javanicus]|uniref:Uncharacterized protein n=1 Tax=Oryzias javanicus TaxID=123683 RepID=A0A3S2Q4Q2_ORYJA|nr:hypothetical protein OJAV_G00084180 [Oryzias javanicus]
MSRTRPAESPGPGSSGSRLVDPAPHVPPTRRQSSSLLSLGGRSNTTVSGPGPSRTPRRPVREPGLTFCGRGFRPAGVRPLQKRSAAVWSFGAGLRRPASDCRRRTAESLFRRNFDRKCNLCPVSFVCVCVRSVM